MKNGLAALLALLCFLPAACKQQEPELIEAVSGSAQVSGSISYRERMALSNQAVVEIKLQDVSIADAPAQLIAQQRITNPGQVPIKFELSFPSGDIDERRSYALEARIFERDQLMFISDTHTPVLTRGAGRDVRMMLVRVQNGKQETTPEDEATGGIDLASLHAELQDTYWKLLEVQGKAVVTPEGMREAHLILATAESRAHGFAGCNNFFGDYQVNGDALSFSPIGATMMACPAGMDTEQSLLQTLGETTRVEISGQMMSLYAADRLLARFEAVYL